MKLDEEQCQEKVFKILKEEQKSDFALIQKAKNYFFNFYEYDSAEESEEAKQEKGKANEKENEEEQKTI